jgi:hypothetical protein
VDRALRLFIVNLTLYAVEGPMVGAGSGEQGAGTYCLMALDGLYFEKIKI